MNQPKFSMPEMMLGVLICLLFDAMATIVGVFSFGIGSSFVKIPSFLIFELWFHLKGIKEEKSPIGPILKRMGIQAIPLIPTLTGTFLYKTLQVNHHK